LRPDVSVELYVRPFVASGRYYDFGQLKAARSRDLLHYGQDGTSIVRQSNSSYLVTDATGSGGQPATFTLPNRDFNVESVRSNFVVRWEYRPGSTLFVVWQQNREGFDERGELVRAGDLFRGYSNVGTNFFAVKANFWIPAL